MPTYEITHHDVDDLRKRFTYHPPREDQPPRYQLLRNVAFQLAMKIQGEAPPSRERSLALTHLEQAIFWANAAIARNESQPREAGDATETPPAPKVETVDVPGQVVGSSGDPTVAFALEEGLRLGQLEIVGDRDGEKLYRLTEAGRQGNAFLGVVLNAIESPKPETAEVPGQAADGAAPTSEAPG